MSSPPAVLHGVRFHRFLLTGSREAIAQRLGGGRWFSCLGSRVGAGNNRTLISPPKWDQERPLLLLQRRGFRVSSVCLEKSGGAEFEREEEEEEPTGNAPYLVYDGALKAQLRHIKLFSMVTSLTGLTFQPIILNTMDQHGKAATAALLTMVGFFTFVTPVLIHLMAKKYVVEIMFDPTTQQYSAATYNFFLMRKELKFKKEDVVVPEVPGPFTSILIKDKEGKQIPLFVALESFIFPKHYGMFMGYDKPLDLQLTAADVAAAVEKKRKDGSVKS